MNKLYTSQIDITSNFELFLKKAVPNIRKTQLNIIPSIMFGMIISESCSSSDIAKQLKDDAFNYVQFNSKIKRINRFWNNKLFEPSTFFKSIITFVLNTYHKKHSDNRVHIIFDHMFSHDNYTVFMLTMRIASQGIPFTFKCFDGNNDDAFSLNTLQSCIKDVSDLFKNRGFELIFLADRWFSSTKLLDFIDSLGHTYCVRLKGNIKVYKDGIMTKAKKLKHRKFKSVIHKDVSITDKRYKTNLIYSASINTSTPWIIVTNGDPKRAIKDYGYRFGGVESVFKNQKSNGFHLNNINNASIKAFTTMYTILCTCQLYLTILGTDFSKNTRCYSKVKIETHKTYIKDGRKVRKRVMSLFNTGLTLFHLAFQSSFYIRLPFSFILYDV